MAKYTCVPPTVNRYAVPARILQDTIQCLRMTGKGVKESVALWQGRVLDDHHAQITKHIVPRQITGPLHFNVPLPERLRILKEISIVGEFILIQLHTHPREAFHSPADDRYAITKHLGAISIVIPDFGMYWDGTLSNTSVNINQGAGVWQELPAEEIEAMFEVT